tara:strand:- start:386 stop:1159 length:774 start_codon:yes stop_codon:yes gene_type:complete
MSSIYKKGRDGYYYYQTYVFNISSGKKDKRVYHSLGTKDRSVAELKQKELDVKYNNEIINPIFGRLKKKQLILIGIILFAIFIIYENINLDRFSNLDNPKSNPETLKINLDYSNQVKETPVVTSFTNEKNDTLSGTLVENNSDMSNPNPVQNFKYKINRIEKISSNFQQGQVFLTINEKYNESTLLAVSEEVAAKYSEFSNIIVCIFFEVNNKELDGPEENFYSISSKNENWLSLYTYNSVEGAFFDPNPGGYVGAY